MRHLILIVLALLCGSAARAQTGGADGQRTVVQHLSDGAWRTVDLHPNGVVAERGRYVRSERSGHWTAYDATGRLTHEAHFHQGEKDGIWRVYDTDGSVLYEIHYDQGERIDAIAYAEP